MVCKKNRYLGILLVTLCACDGSSNTKSTVTSWLEQIKQSMRPLVVWLDTLTATAPVENKNTENKSGQASDNQPQAQAQIIAAMENILAAPVDNPSEKQMTREEITQLHNEFDKAVTLDDKVDALVTLLEADANNAATLLRDAYADPDPEVRKQAVLQMQAFTDQSAVVELLLTALGDADSSVVIEAVEGLAHVQDLHAIAGLKKTATTHPDEDIREVAQDYVEQLEQSEK
jgi:HEAT repeats